jgi:hypothetical protein
MNIGCIGKRVGRKVLAQVACVAKPDTILAWYRRLIAQKFGFQQPIGLTVRSGTIWQGGFFLVTRQKGAKYGEMPWRGLHMKLWRCVYSSVSLLCLPLTFGQQVQSETVRLDRLVALCKLWSAVKLFHPYLACRDDIDWDKALIEAIPKASAAKTPDDYASAVDAMLHVLHDSASHIMRKDDRHAEKPAVSGRPLDPSFRYTPDQILLINMTHYEDLQDVDGAFQRFGALAKEIPKTRAALFDLRSPGFTR